MALTESSASARILSKDMRAFVADCYSGEGAPCMEVCPLGLDVREFIARIQRGNFKSAYNYFRDQVIFPAIVCSICEQPCKDVCARKDADTAIDIQKLERASIDFAGSNDPVKYNSPKKNKTVAIVGAGLCGLSCMIRLTTHGYDVVVFEKTANTGGCLHALLADEKFMEEIELQTNHLDFDLKTGVQITNIDELKNFDAVLLATGSNGDDFGLISDLNRESLGSAVDGFFLGGGLIGSTPIEAIENGIRASQSIESYLKIGRMNEMTGVNLKKANSRLKINSALFLPSERPPESEKYTKEQASLEAAACPRCDCIDCQRSCDFMLNYGRLPKKIVRDVQVHLNPVDGLQGSKGNIMINSCNACGLCAEVCSEDINMGDFLLNTRSIMHREGTLPPVFHDFWMRDMYHALGENAYLAKNAPGYEKSEFLFFPGCQLGASNPTYIIQAYDYLREKQPSTGLLLGCCGAPAEWAGETNAMTEICTEIRKVWEDFGKPEIVFACPSCKKMLNKYLPEIKLVSLYEIILRHGLPYDVPASNTTAGKSVSVYDPCSSRNDSVMQESVRKLVAMTGYSSEEIPTSGQEANCCGFGGHIYPANKDLASKIAENRITLGSHPYITYCINCHDIFTAKGKECAHVLDLVFTNDDNKRPIPSISRKRENREILQKDLLRQIWDYNTNMETKEKKIVLDSSLEQKLDRLLILESDIVETIEFCETNGSLLQNPDTGSYIGHRRLGLVTYWVEYIKEENQYIVKNAYSHRMQIEGE